MVVYFAVCGLAFTEAPRDAHRAVVTKMMCTICRLTRPVTTLCHRYALMTTYGDRVDGAFKPPAEMAWLTIHRDFDLVGEQEDLLHHVAALHDAY